MTARDWTPIDRLADEWVRTLARLSPTFATYAGFPTPDDALDDYSPEGTQQWADEARAMLRRVEQCPTRDTTDQVTKSGMIEDLRLSLDIVDSRWALRELNNIESPPQYIRDSFDLMPTDTPEDWEAIARRLAAVPRALEGYTRTLQLGIHKNITPARRQVEVVIRQLTDGYGRTSLFQQLAATAPESLPSSLRRALDEGAQAATGAYRALIGFLREEELPAAAPSDGVGRDWYQLLSRQFVGTAVDLDETYEWGMAELQRMRDEQAAVAHQIVPGGTVADAVAALDTDPRHLLHGTDALRAWMQRLADDAVTALGKTAFDIPEPVRTIECLIAPTQTGGIYYTAPSDGFTRPGRMWWSVPPGVTDFHTWRETTTVYHEGVPGHHLQLGMAVYLSDQLNSWRRLASGSSGFFEGWALYAERLMDEFGYLNDPADRLGMLDGQRMRAARILVDIGVHVGKQRPDGAGTWDGDYALDFFRREVSLDPQSTAFEVNRYLGWPGQAPSYKIGQRVWEQTRDAYLAARPGSTLREFHHDALSLGSLTLDGLRRALAPDAPSEEQP